MIRKIAAFCLVLTTVSCMVSCKSDGDSSENKSMDQPLDSTKKEMWAELVESKTIFVKPEGWDEDYWNSVNKNVSTTKLFNTLVDAVLSGKKQAYDIFTDSLLTIQQVAEMTGKLPAPTGGSVSETVKADDLSLLRMREKWVFDKEKFRLDKRVTRIDLVYKKVDENGEYIGDKPLFYVNLE